MSSKWNSLIVKVMVVFFLVITPLYGLSVLFTFNSSGQMREEIEHSNESVLLFHYSNLQLELSRLSNLNTEFSVDGELADFGTVAPVMSQYAISQRLNSILLKLRQMKSSSPYIKDVRYYIPSLNKTVSVASSISESNPGEWQGLIESQGTLNGSISQYDGNLYLIKSNPVQFNASTEPNFLLAIQLSSGQLLRQLRNVKDDRTGGAFLTFGSDNKVVHSDGDVPDDWVSLLQNREDRQYGQIMRTVTDRNHIYSIHNETFQFRFVSYTSNSALYEPMERYSFWMWGLTIMSCLIIVVFSYWILRLFHRPLGKLVKAFRTLERGDTTKAIEHKRGDEFGYLYNQFNKTVERLHSLIKDNYMQRIHTQDAHLKQLQSQIAPHFLYNSLFTIKQMAEMEDIDGIQRFSDYLGRYFRFMTRDFERDVSLKQEVEHSLVYLNIQQIRFSNRISIEAEPLPEHVQSVLVPRIILQPLLENVFAHGLGQRTSGDILKLSHREEEHALVILVEDNGDNLTDETLAKLQNRLAHISSLQIGEATGVLNVHNRLRIRFGPDYGLQLSRSPLGGLRVEVRLPLQPESSVLPDAAHSS